MLLQSKPCPVEGCGQILSGRDSQWQAHELAHERQKDPDRREWVNTEPYWRWAYELVNAGEDVKAASASVVLVRSRARRNVPSVFTLILDAPRHAREEITLKSATVQGAQDEAVEIFTGTPVVRRLRGPRRPRLSV